MNDSEQNNNNGNTKYLEVNKDSILYLTEKDYENLVKALTNNAIDNAGAFYSSNPKPALPPSASIFLNLSNQNDIDRTEESKI